MRNLRLDNPVKFIFGPGEVSKAGEEAKSLGKKALIITGKSSVKKTGTLDKVKKSLDAAGVKYVIYSDITPNPKVLEIDAAGGLARKENCDIIIGLGGGSAMDAAKGASIVAGSGGSVWDYMSVGSKTVKPIGKAVPIIMIPTLPASGSEGNPAAVFTNTKTNEKAGIYNPDKLFPKISIFDPDLTLTIPPKPTAEGVIDIIMHVLEEYLTGDTDCDLQDRITEGIILTCMENVDKVLENPSDKQARANIALASSVALMGLPNAGRAGAWVVHPMEHAITGFFDNIAHGSGIAALLPAYLKYLGETKPDKVIQLSKRIFEPCEELDDSMHITNCVEGFKDFILDIDLKDNLEDLGVKEEMLEKFADKYLSMANMEGNKDEKEKLMKIYRYAWEGV
jgi:alcohol dehydrogenase YqhD (iron-dependent ADH family)